MTTNNTESTTEHATGTYLNAVSLSPVQRGLAAVCRIPLQRWLALMLIVLEAVTISYLSKTTFYPILIICVAVFGTLSTYRFSTNRQRTYDIIALMAVGFVIKYMVSPDNPRYLNLFPSQQLAFVLSQYVLALQCVQFFLQRRDDRLPFSFPGIGVIALVCAAMVSPADGERSTIQGQCVVFAILAVLFCDASRKFIKVVPTRRFGRPVATILVLLAVSSLGWFTASSMFRYERYLEHFVRRLLEGAHNGNSRIGFSETSTLGSVSLTKDSNSEHTALRVVAAVRPDYFRARVYDRYQNEKWQLERKGRVRRPTIEIPNGIPVDVHAGQPFRITRTVSQGTQTFEVWPDVDLRGTYAAPLQTSWLYANANVVTINAHKIMRSASARTGVPYTLIVGDATPPPSAVEHVQGELSRSWRASGADLELLRTPPEWASSSKRVADLTRSLVKDCQTDREKIQAILRYFHQNYSYSLNVSPPEKLSGQTVDPLEWFLLEQPSAHCEYFASGATVLLRMADVPCRYVVGFVISEKNQFSGEWIARNKDAHAWAEAYDETRGWVTVEATPDAGIPDDSATSSWTQLYEYLRDEFHRLRVDWQQEGIASLGPKIRALASSRNFILLIVGSLFCAAAVLLWRRRRRHHVGSTAHVMVSPEMVLLQRAREKLDRVVTRAWRIRLPGETVPVYARQLAANSVDPVGPLAQTAAWYQLYSSLRYVEAPDESAISEITQQVDQLVVELKLRKKHSVGPDESES